MKQLLGILFIIFYCTKAHSQVLHVDSTRFITGTQPYTQINYAIPTADKGILFAGSATYNAGGIIPTIPYGYENVFIGKIDSSQHISWLKEYGGSDDDGAASIVETVDGGYAVLASTGSNDGDVTGYKGSGDMWLLRIDASGNLLWQQCYGSSHSDEPVSIANTPDHGFIMLGATNGSDGDVPFHYGDFFLLDWVVIKTDSVGHVQWSKTIGGTGSEGPNGSILSVDSSYYVIGSSDSRDYDCKDTAWHAGVTTSGDYHILKLNDTGKVLWDSSYGGTGQDIVATAVYDGRDSTIVMIGNTSSADYMVTGYQGNGDIWAVKVNRNGGLIWQKTLGSTDEDYGTGICIKSNGGYLSYGWTHNTSGTMGQEDLWLFSLDNNGNELNNKKFGGTHVVESSCSVVPYLTGYVATGNSSAYSFTEGTTYGNFDTSSRYPNGGGAFVSYLDSNSLGINELHPIQTSYLEIFPNPADENITVLIRAHQTGSLKVVNYTGKVIYERQIVSLPSVRLDIKEWTSGVYFVEWMGGDGMVQTGKFIKM